jgi:hypothetical protein
MFNDMELTMQRRIRGVLHMGTCHMRCCGDTRSEWRWYVRLSLGRFQCKETTRATYSTEPSLSLPQCRTFP